MEIILYCTVKQELLMLFAWFWCDFPFDQMFGVRTLRKRTNCVRTTAMIVSNTWLTILKNEVVELVQFLLRSFFAGFRITTNRKQTSEYRLQTLNSFFRRVSILFALGFVVRTYLQSHKNAIKNLLSLEAIERTKIHTKKCFLSFFAVCAWIGAG